MNYTSPDILEILARRAKRKAEREQYDSLSMAEKGAKFGDASWYHIFNCYAGLGSRTYLISGVISDDCFSESKPKAMIGHRPGFREAARGAFARLLQAWVDQQPDAAELAHFFNGEAGRQVVSASPAGPLESVESAEPALSEDQLSRYYASQAELVERLAANWESDLYRLESTPDRLEIRLKNLGKRIIKALAHAGLQLKER